MSLTPQEYEKLARKPNVEVEGVIYADSAPAPITEKRNWDDIFMWLFMAGVFSPFVMIIIAAALGMFR